MRIFFFLALLTSFVWVSAQSFPGDGTYDPNSPSYLITELNNVPFTQKGALVNCPVDPGEVPFSIQILSDSAYNGFDLICSDSCSGYFTANVTGGVGPFQFFWFATTNGTPTNTQKITEVCNQSQIQVIVTDVGQGISCGATHTLNVPTEVTTINFSFTDPSCPTTCDGAANHTPFFGVPPYTFQWSNGNTDEDADDLCLGPNTLVITDDNGCTFDTTINIANPPLMAANIVIDPVSCDGVCDASAVSNPTGGNGGPYDFSWEQLPTNAVLLTDNGPNSTSPGNLCENISYQLLIEDSDGCPYDTTFTIEDVLPMTLTVDQNIDATCANSCDGQIDVTISGGSGVYSTIQWSEGLVGAPTGVHAAGPSISQNDLCPNTNYFITVIDDQGCVNTFQLPQISSPPPLTFVLDNQVDVTCQGANDGLIEITIGGGTPIPGYNYVWSSIDGGTGFGVNTEDQINVLSGGTYRVIYEDALGCKDSADVVVDEPDAISTNGVVTNVSCFDLTDGEIDLTTTGGNGGYTWTWSASANGASSLIDNSLEDQTSLDSASYSVNIVDALGCTYDTTITISKPGEIFFNSVVTQMQCEGDDDAIIDNSAASNGVGGFIFSWTSNPVVPIGDVNGVSNSNLEPADYTITIMDGNGCDKDTLISIDALDPLVITSSFLDVVCNGDDDGAISLTVVTGEAPVSVSWTGPTPILNNDFAPTALAPGNYQATVTDANGCFEVLNFSINEPDQLTAELLGTNLSCNGVPDGSVTVAPNGGLLGTSYAIDWDTDARGDFDDLLTLNPVLAGTYCVNIRDDNNCVLALDSCIIITEPDSIFFTGSSIVDVTCFGDQDGAISLVTTGGTVTGSYGFNWNTVEPCYSGATNVSSISTLCGGTYAVVVTDDNGCTNDTTFVIDEPEEILVTSSVTDVVCNGADDGTILITVTSGDGPMSVTWIATGGGSAIIGTSNFNPTGLAPGNYQATVSDIHSCIEVLNFVIDEPTPLVATVTGTDLDCNGVPTGGSVTVVPSGGFVGSTYLIDWDTDVRGDFDDLATLSPLLAGTYCVNIRDDNNCVLALDSCITITEPDSIFFLGSTQVDVTCFGANDGSINVVNIGGTEGGTYDYTWTVPACSGPFGNVNAISPLCGGTYSVTATDDNGCTNDTTFIVDEPQELVLTSAFTNVICGGDDDGTISITVVSGDAPVTVTWVVTGGGTAIAGNSQFTPTGLAPGNYEATVSDANNCTDVLNFVIGEPDPLVATITTTDLDCNGVPTGGSVTVVPSGGLLGTAYGIDWDTDVRGDFDDAAIQTPLLAGTYCVNIRDDNNCTLLLDSCITIVEPDSIFFAGTTVNEIDCFGNDNASINLVLTGGTEAGAYDFTWSPIPACSGPLGNNANVGPLCPGTYTVTATDDNGCTNDTTFSFTEPVLLTASSSHTDATCGVNDGTVSVSPAGGTVAGTYNIAWTAVIGTTPPTPSNGTNITGLAADTYDVTVTDDNGCTVTSQEIIQSATPPIITIDQITNLNCNGSGLGAIQTTVSGGLAPYSVVWGALNNATFTATSEDIFLLDADQYTIQVTDANSCVAVMVVDVTEPDALSVTLDNLLDVSCNGLSTGAINITGVGGTVATDYTYSWTGTGSYSNNVDDISGLSIGTYCINIIDDNGCRLLTDSCYTIIEPTVLQIDNISSTDAQCNVATGTATVVASGGSVATDYTYSWVNIGAGANPTVNNASTATGMVNDPYTVTVTDDNGCTTTASIAVQPTNGPAITIDLVNHLTCANDGTGAISTTPGGGSGTLTYSWSSIPSGQIAPNLTTDEDLIGLEGGTYIVSVTDGAACTTNDVIVINEPAPLTISDNIIDAICNGANGSVDITVGGGTSSTGNYVYNWDNNGGSTFTDSEDLSEIAGTYNVIAADDNGCIINGGPYVISEPSAITASTSSAPSACLQSTGSVSVTVGGGTPGVAPNQYLYLWTDQLTSNPVGNTPTASPLTSGCYDVQITDGNGCVVTTTECISDLNGPTITIDQQLDPICSGSADGQIDLTITTASGSPTTTWTATNGSTITTNGSPEDIFMLAADDYNVTVTDVNMCVATQSITLIDVDAIDVVATVSDPNCASGTDGFITITAINNAINPIASTTWTGPSFTSSSQDISSLQAGTYCLTLIDANGCQLDTCFTLNTSPPLTVISSSLDTDCNAPTGQVNANATGGVPGYIYDWTGPGITTHPSGALVTGLISGTYNLTVTDANGCETTSIEQVFPLSGPILTIDGTNDVDCFGDATGDIFISTSGGTLPYLYDWDNIIGIDDPEDNLSISAGTYNLTVTDGSGCDAAISVTINQPAAPLAFSGVINHLACNADASGSIDLTITGGTSSYIIDWTQGGTAIGSIISASGVFTIPNLDALSYDVLITDANGCTTTQSFLLNEPTVILPVTTFMDSDCGLSNGQVAVTASGGTDGVTYTYSWVDFTSGLATTTPTLATVPGLPQGTYEVTVEDLNGCQVTALASVSEVGGPTVSGTTTPVQCFGDMNGTIDLTVVGPPTISYSWTGPTAIGNVEDPISLDAGNYAVAVTDGNGCITNDNFTVNGPASAIVVNGAITNLTCFEDGQGSIDLTITGGTPGFTYSWTGPNGYINTIEDINNLEAGTYTVDVEDSEGCQILGTSFVVTQPDEIIATPTITGPTCGIADGAVIANVTGGTLTASPDYTYEWTDVSGPTVMPDTDNDIASIFAGNYQLVVEDDNGCSDTTVVSVSNVNAPPISFVTTDITCFSFDNGTIDLTVSGTNTYTYDWDNLVGAADPEDQSSLSPGTYAVSVLESPTGCISAGNVTLIEPDVLTVSGVEDHLECFEDGSGGIDITAIGGTGTLTYDWDNLIGTNDPEDQSSIGAGPYQVTVTDANGCIVIDSYTLTEPLEIDITAVIVQNDCNGQQLGSIDVTTTNGVGALTFAWDTPSTNEDETALFAGFYQFSVTDANACTNDSIFEITEPTAIVFDGVVTDANCNLQDGQILTTVSGGTLTSPDYTYDWQSGGVNVGSGPDLLLQGAGTYVLTVTDDAGCFDDTTIIINNINAPVLTLDNIVDVTCFGDADGDINITTTGGTTPYTYVWNPNGVSQSEDLIDQAAGTYDVQVTDGSGCISTLTGLIINTPAQVGGTVVSNDATCGICNGDATVSGFGGDGSFNYLWSSSNTAPLESSMCPGVYNVQITDGTGCSITENVVISNIGGPTGETITTVDPDCNGDTDGTATVTAIGGVAPITYFWPHDGTVGTTHTALSAGTYFVEMSDFNGCIRIAQVDIFEPNAITFNSIVTPSTCTNADGDITLTNITGGAAPINILWDNPSGLNTPGNPNISAGIYNVTLSDANGCSVAQSFTITDQNAPDLTLSPSDVLCNLDINGTITSTITGAIGAISYQWMDASPSALVGETNADINTIGAGSYTLQATDAGTGCIVLETATINEPDALTMSLPTVQDASCDIACDGEATVIVAGGTLPYTFGWPTVATGQTATDLCVGFNTVSITDANGCIIQTTIDIDFDNQLNATLVETDATCGDCDGLATVSPIGGSGNYTVNWYDATVGTSHNQLCAGIYDFTILDNISGCSVDLDATINNIGGPDNETITITDVTCADGTDGAATVVPSGGTAPYGFLWVPAGQTTGTISGQAAGSYNLEVTDANGCIRVVPVTIDEPAGMDLQFLSTDANCGSADGTITLISVNGIAPISYVWNGPGLVGTTNPSESNLAIGTYTISATDASGCTVTIQVPISTTTAPVFTASALDITCNGLDDGTATAVGVGMTFDWSTGASGATISGLSGGTYVVTATDNTTGCAAVHSVIVNEPDTLMMAVSNVDTPLCFGDCNGEITAVADGGTIPYTYAWSSSGNTDQLETGLCDGVTTITVTDANGCITSEAITVTEPLELTVVIDNITDATCVNSQDGIVDVTAAGGTVPYSYAWTTTPSGFTSANEDLTGLDPTTYNLTVTDANGCIAMEIAAVDTIFIVLADAGLDTAFCINECAVIQGSGIGPGGINYEWNSVPAITVLSTADTVEVCPALDGTYPFTLTVSDVNCTHTDTVLVTVNPLPIVDAGPDLDEVIGSLQNIGGNPTGPINSTYYWTPNTDFISLNDTAASNPEIEMNTTLDYYVFVTDTNGCVNSDTVNVRPIPEISFPNGFTPNGDGVNDDWQIDYIDQFPECVVEVYNRWGELLFRNIGYTQRWDGKFNGNDLPVGTYYYIIELNDPLFPEPYSGPVTIMR